MCILDRLTERHVHAAIAAAERIHAAALAARSAPDDVADDELGRLAQEAGRIQFVLAGGDPDSEGDPEYGFEPIPFSLTCQGCDAGQDQATREQAEADGWQGIFRMPGLAEANYVGICPDCADPDESLLASNPACALCGVTADRAGISLFGPAALTLCRRCAIGDGWCIDCGRQSDQCEGEHNLNGDGLCGECRIEAERGGRA